MCGAQRIRQRFCNTPIPWQGGNYCFGDSRQQEACNTSYTTSSLIGEVLHILELIKGIKTEKLKPTIVHGLKYCIYNCYKPFIAKLTWDLLVLFGHVTDEQRFEDDSIESMNYGVMFNILCVVFRPNTSTLLL